MVGGSPTCGPTTSLSTGHTTRTSMTSSFKYYVIRNGSYLELRRARTRPKRYVSTLTLTCKEKVGGYYSEDYREFKRTFKQVSYVGGKSVGFVHVKQLNIPTFFKNYTMQEVSREVWDAFLATPRFKA